MILQEMTVQHEPVVREIVLFLRYRAYISSYTTREMPPLIMRFYKAGWRTYLSNKLWTEKACHIPRRFYICISVGIMTILQTVWIEHGRIHLKVEAKILGTLLSFPREQTRKLRSQASGVIPDTRQSKWRLRLYDQ